MADELQFKHKKVQRLRKLVRKRDFRAQEGAFVIEGFKLLEEAVTAGADIESVFCSSNAEHPAIEAAESSGVRVHYLASGVLERVTDTVTPQPVVGVVRMAQHSTDVLNEVDSVVVLADVRDPGNAGTILRSAEAAGVGAVVVADGSVDVYNPKTVRSSAGAVFQVPIVQNMSVTKSLQVLKSKNFLLLGTAGTGETPYDEADLTRRVAIVLGNEANGLGEQLLGEMDQVVMIPIIGRSESLNVSMAGAVLCFELARQRRNGSK